MQRYLTLPLVMICLTAIFACSGSPTPTENQPAASTSAEKPVESPGETVYNQNCRMCHMPKGEGVAGLNPPLAQTDWVNGDKERLIALILNGMSGPIEVNSTTYNGIMTPYTHLSDTDIAAVLSYIRSSFGNQSGPVTADEVAAVRAGDGS